ncbi:Solute carrier family 25 member 40 [Porphyridium purpureum]|uniref:Solute carrier family 25 member 40 n=1 Tax=Porphyridium purpureum TaxID=35688 RepID=A0A5J4YSV6_PORPP|nr:Solute carrier family 25 member 40 [Porphyridium purpureum]|eukprot:POR6177..scf227_4
MREGEDGEKTDRDGGMGSTEGATSSRTSVSWRMLVRNALSSSVGACVTALVMTPLDVVKVRLQAHSCEPVGLGYSKVVLQQGVGSSAACVDPASHYRGVIDALVRIPRQHGVRELWRGLGTSMMLAVPTTGVYFTLYEYMMSLHANASRQDGSSSTGKATVALLAGMTARSITATLAAPLELARTRAQANSANSDAARALSYIRAVWRSDGARALFRGLGPTLVRDVPFSGIYWLLYEPLKARHGMLERMLQSVNLHKDPGRSMELYILAGSMAGMVAAATTNPADVVKTRLQANRRKGSVGVMETVRAIYSADGAVGFTRGIGARVGKVAPACAIMMASYEFLRHRLYTWETQI